ncbi:phosphatase PAP2 family protein [Microbacterium sp. NM3R9]|uniref:phosphatase PAP2 family protein n=1 Tax=Microbacterium thalli TaxID=3027921 RepID=UPI002366B527|nr:phosphatase PAP2 family protein [Microbacterium thalli]MDD7928013.1 phosphatase PAP2 family protein [Microbacterium thalli]MDN8548159.1 phosphatase PAP2 family protein [Microbacterium thalli]
MNRGTQYLRLALLQALAVAITVAVSVFTANGQLVDQAVMDTTIQSSDPAVRLARQFGENTVVIVAAGLVIGSVVLALARRRFADAAIAVTVFAGAALTSNILKHNVIVRPDLTLGLDEYSNSLPSGHATLAIAAACAALFAAPRHLKLPLVPVLTGWAILSGFGVIAAGWHRPSDVVTASLIVGFWCSAASGLRALLHRPGGGADRAVVTTRRSRIATSVLVSGSVVAAIALSLSYAVGTGRTVWSAALIAIAITATTLAALYMSLGSSRAASASRVVSARGVATA